jgi:hypothetical protein
MRANRYPSDSSQQGRAAAWQSGMSNIKSRSRAVSGRKSASKAELHATSATTDWAAIRQRLRDFVVEYRQATYERGQAQPYWNAFLRCYGVTERVLSKAFEHRLKLGKKNNYIDAFIPGKLIVEHKGSHVDLGSAVEQLQGYYGLLPPSEQPRFAVLCNFQHLRLYDFTNLARTVVHECAIEELPEKAELFKFLLPDEDSVGFLEQPGVDIKAARAVADLHAALAADGYGGRDLEVVLTRLIFCFFGDDTGIFGENVQFHRLLGDTAEDGSDLGPTLNKLFEVLDTPVASRSSKLHARFADFAYINGQLFAESCRLPDFDAAQRAVILQCSSLNWGSISPAIFGSMFQAVLETGRDDAKKLAAARRELGAHYTSERNILRALGPLFLDQLKAELESAKNNKAKLQALHAQLAAIHLLDPACGCGNFLVVAFQQLRLLEIEIVYRLYGDARKSRGLLDMRDLLRVQVDQFYGIEIDRSATHIARVALWITDHQMNLVAAQRLGQARPSVPLVNSATIIEGNALRLDWASVLPPAQCSYVVGNPPFVGAKFLNDNQRNDVAMAFGDLKNAGLLDLVAAWYVKAARYIQAAPAVRVAFVSTNSITQGEQVGVLWSWMLAQGMNIHFAHRTFQWSNDAKGVAAVHCVIIGFGAQDQADKLIYEYSDIKGEPVSTSAINISPYLVDASNVIIGARRTPVCDIPEIVNGSIPADGGNLILSPAERSDLIANEPAVRPWIRKYLGAEGFINNEMRYCLWLVGCNPEILRVMPEVMRRVKAVRLMREKSDKEATRRKGATPTLFTENRQPLSGKYLAIPRTSSERRIYLPIGYLDSKVIAANDLQIIPGAEMFHFGVLSSVMHKAWTCITSGRLKSDIRYSVKLTYNTFPWPDAKDKNKAAIEVAAQAVLDARSAHQRSSLADLYDPLTMPPELIKAHHKLDKAVDAAYGYSGKHDDAMRVAFLFGLYQQIVGAGAAAAK